jgi:predicted HTH domain antitoxin
VLQVSVAAIEIPEDAYDALRLPEGEREGVMREELACSLYDRGVLSFGKAQELAGLSKREFGGFLGERGIERHYTDEELAEDVEYARR